MTARTVNLPVSVVVFVLLIVAFLFWCGGNYAGWSSYRDNHPVPVQCAPYGDGQACIVDGDLTWQADQQPPVNLTEQAKFQK